MTKLSNVNVSIIGKKRSGEEKGSHLTYERGGLWTLELDGQVGNRRSSAAFNSQVKGPWSFKMQTTFSKTMVAGVAAISLASVFAMTEPASAAFRYGGGGFYGGGWHGDGWRGGGWGWGGGGWWAPAFVGGLAAGALISPPYGYGYGSYCGYGFGPYCGYGYPGYSVYAGYPAYTGYAYPRYRVHPRYRAYPRYGAHPGYYPGYAYTPPYRYGYGY